MTGSEIAPDGEPENELRPAERGSTPRAGSSADRILARLEVWGQRLGLERIDSVLEALGRPQDRLPTVLVAGTNGKGSTSALLSSIARECGARCGLYTSPHLEQVEERLKIDGRSISGSELGSLLEEVLAAAANEREAPPTYFEALTAAAYLHFSRREVDLAVFEVGLGGRLDATNAGEPLLSVVTPIGLDHREHLGRTLGRIAREKGGIARPGKPLLTWSRSHPTVRRALREVAAERGALLFECDREVTGSWVEERGTGGDRRSRIHLETPADSYRLDCPLLGAHQVTNVALAVRAAEILGELGELEVDRGAVERGVAACRWPGRLERVSLPDGGRVLLDAAHNLEGARALTRYLDELGEAHDLLYGSLRGKRAKKALPLIAERCVEVTLTEPPSDRALAAEHLAGYLEGRRPRARIEPDLGHALSAALERAQRPLLICGSLYLVGALRVALRERYGVPAAAVDRGLDLETLPAGR